MIHRQTIEQYPGTLTDLAAEVGDLRYDVLAAFLHALAAKLAADGAADAGRHRPRLAAPLQDAGTDLAAAARDVEQVWSIYSPRMDTPDSP